MSLEPDDGRSKKGPPSRSYATEEHGHHQNQGEAGKKASNKYPKLSFSSRLPTPC